MTIDQEKLLEKAMELLDGKIGHTSEAIATNRLAGAVLILALLQSEQSVVRAWDVRDDQT